MAGGAITDCKMVNPTQWIQIEYGYFCSGSNWCPNGWSWETYDKCWGYRSKDGCKREVCNDCFSGKYKSGFSQGYATSCTLCPQIIGCRSQETCSDDSNSQCLGCSIGSYLKQASADSCTFCSTIDGCDSGKTTCTSSLNQVRSKWKNGYFLSNFDEKCTKCPVNFHCDGINRRDCWDSLTYCPNKGTTSATRQ